MISEPNSGCRSQTVRNTDRKASESRVSNRRLKASGLPETFGLVRFIWRGTSDLGGKAGELEGEADIRVSWSLGDMSSSAFLFRLPVRFADATRKIKNCQLYQLQLCVVGAMLKQPRVHLPY